MIRKIVIVVLVLAAVGTCLLWRDSYRNRIVANGSAFHGWCFDCKLGGRMGIHTTIRVGGVCFSFRKLISRSVPFSTREHILTGNLGYSLQPYRWCGLDVEHGFAGPAGTRLIVHTVCLPLWGLALALAFFPTFWFIRGPIHRYRRRKRGLCVTCGYDLRGSPERCPECGKDTNGIAK